MTAIGDVLALKHVDRHAQLLDAAAQVFDRRRRGGVTHGDAGTGGVQQAHRFVGQLPARDVAIRQPHGFDNRFVQDSHAVMPFECVDQAAHHFDGRLFARLFDLHDLKPPGQGRILLEIFLILGPSGGGDRAQLAASEGRLEQVCCITLAGRAAGADHRVGFVDEDHDRRRRGFHFVDHRFEPVLEFAFDARPGLQQAEIERSQRDILQCIRHVAGRDLECKAFDDGRFSDAGFAGENRIVLAAAREDVDDLANFGVAPQHGIDLLAASQVGQIRGELIERRSFGIGRDGAAVGAGGGRRSARLRSGGFGFFGRARGEGD